METNREAEDTVDERRFARVPYRGRVQFECGAGSKGSAQAGDVGRGGMRVRMGRYLRPGTKLMITISLEGSNEQTVELKSEVVWCRRGPGSTRRIGPRSAEGVRSPRRRGPRGDDAGCSR